MTLEEVISKLHELRDNDKIIRKEKQFGIVSKNALGVYQKVLTEIAKTIGKNNDLALKLYDSGIYEAKLLCSKLYKPKDVTEPLMEKRVREFDNWEICDSFSMKLFARSNYAISKAKEWSNRKREFEKRAGYVIMATYCMADKQAENEVYEGLLPIIVREAHDERLYVKKAINWALRNIGKRNVDLNKKSYQNCL